MIATLKDWGTSTQIFKTPYVEVLLLHINEDKESSLHHHDHKHSLIKVITGRVSFYYSDPRRPKSFNMQELDERSATATIPAGVIHGFKAVTKSVVLEIYHSPDVNPEDIVTDFATISDHNRQRSSFHSI